MLYQRKTDVVARSVAGESLLIPVQGCTTSVYTLNPSACMLWDLLEQPGSEVLLVEALTARYKIAREVAQKDVSVFLADMLSMGLVVACD